MKNFTLFSLATFLFLLIKIPTSTAAPFTPGNIVVYRIGDGTAALTSAASPVFLDEYTPAGVLVQSVSMPTTINGPNKALTSGINAGEGKMTRSADGQYLIVPGYDAAVGSSFVGTSATDINRVIGRVDFNGAINTTTALDDAFFVGNFYSAASTNGSDFWVGGTDDVRYTTIGSTTSSSVAATSSELSVNIFNGQLYVGRAVSTSTRVQQIGTGTPTTSGNSITDLPGVSTGNSVGQFFFADINPAIAGVDVLYMTVPTATIGIAKYSFDGTTWNANGILAAGSSLLRGITGVVTGTTVTLYATDPTNIFSLVDASGYNSTITGTYNTVTTAAANTQFRGVTLTPVAATLPLTLTSNKISFNGTIAQIKWITSNEENIKGFAIERSSNGSLFTEIGYVAAKNSKVDHSYFYNDEAINPGAGFYRIRMEDMDGNIKYSSVMAINNKLQLKINLYPNPVSQELTITHPKALMNTSIQLVTMDGKLLKTYRVKEGTVQTDILVNKLSKGNYHLVFSDGLERIVTSFTKQ